MQSMIDGHVAAGEIAGAVAVIAVGDDTAVATSGVQDIDTNIGMRRDTIFRIMSMTKPITAAAAMILVEDGSMALDDPVERWLPELSTRRVLRTNDSELDDVVPAARSIVVEDLLTLRLGLGWLPDCALGREMARLGVAPGPNPVPLSPDEFMTRIGRLPLAAQPGERWIYHTGADILTVLISRVAGKPLGEFLADRLFDPLGMVDTGFFVSRMKLGRLATGYSRSDAGLAIADPAVGGHYSAPPVFPSELVSTADDYLRFARMLLRGGSPVLSRGNVERMMQDQISAAQKAVSPFFPGFWDETGWGYGGGIVTHKRGDGPSVGSYGWDGGFGTTMTIDPHTDTVVILLLQRLMTGPADTTIGADLRRIAFADRHPHPSGDES